MKVFWKRRGEWNINCEGGSRSPIRKGKRNMLVRALTWLTSKK